MQLIPLLYLAAAVLFIIGVYGLRHPKSANQGNILAMIGMALAVGVTLMNDTVQDFAWVIGGIALGAAIGLPLAGKVQTTALPQLVALFNGLVGLAAAFVGVATYLQLAAFGAPEMARLGEVSLSVLIGAMTFSGSVIAAGKLSGKLSSKPVTLPLGHISTVALILTSVASAAWLVMDGGILPLIVLFALTLAVGLALTLPIGGADMPVVIALFNAYSGWAGVATGFMLGNALLVIGGSLVGASGFILTYIMCQAMNRSFLNVLLGGVGADENAAAPTGVDTSGKTVKQAGVEDAAFMLQNARKVVVVPGYGMAVAQAQHALKDMMLTLESMNVDVKFAIHPVAGRMPGHMNVLLAEADVPYENVVEMDTINPQFPQTDVVLVIGANDVVNPDAKNMPESPLYGMPVLEADRAKQVYVIKRSMRTGYSGVENGLFYLENTALIFGDAKDVCEKIGTALKA